MSRTRQAGFTLLEVLIAMSILAVGATSVLSIFVYAISYQTRRVEANRLTELWNHVIEHAKVEFNEFDPSSVQEGQPKVPKPIVADLRAPEAPGDPDPKHSMDPMIAEAATKFPGFQYSITFEDNDLAVPGSSVVVSIEIKGLSGNRNETFSQKQILTRDGSPIAERFKKPDLSKYNPELGGTRPQ